MNLKTKLRPFPWFSRVPQSKFESNFLGDHGLWSDMQTNRQTEITTLYIDMFSIALIYSFQPDYILYLYIWWYWFQEIYKTWATALPKRHDTSKTTALSCSLHLFKMRNISLEFETKFWNILNIFTLCLESLLREILKISIKLQNKIFSYLNKMLPNYFDHFLFSNACTV